MMGVCVGAWLGSDEGSMNGAEAWLSEPPALSLSVSPGIHLKVK